MSRQILAFLQIISYLINGVLVLPLSQTSTSPPTPPSSTKSTDTFEKHVVFSHDENPFDATSNSFQMGSNLNTSQPSPNSISKSPIVKLHQVIPLPKPSNNTRQMRVHVFRPLFVYRQEQAMKNRPNDGRPPIDADRFYHNYPYYHYYHHHHHENQQQQQQQQHHYASRYPDLYDSFPFKNFDYVANDLSAENIPTYDFWYP